ncbi:MAG: SGNH/GDSL hydrolase family protein [Chitinophagaceae bacterium]
MKIRSVIFSMLILFSLVNTVRSQDKTYSYLALGDSYTKGESIAPIDCFPNQLAMQLRQNGFHLQDPKIIAKTGWTTDELDKGINAAAITGTYDLVTLLIGVNNQFRGRSVAEYEKQFEALLKRAIEFAGGKESHVIVLSIPDWGATPFGASRDRSKIAMEINIHNDVNKKIAESYRVQYADITMSSREALVDKELLAEDKLHLSAKEYTRWVEILVPIAEKILK